jgi:flagellar basal body-associated protein FliL
MPEADRAPARKKSKLPMAVAAVVIASLGGAGIFFWMSSARSTSAAGSGAVAFTLPLETFVVNLSGTERGYLRVGIALGLSRAPSHKGELPVALARDTILSVLSAVKAEELTPPDSKDKLKSQILRALKERAPQLGVADVYFTEFLVQM